MQPVPSDASQHSERWIRARRALSARAADLAPVAVHVRSGVIVGLHDYAAPPPAGCAVFDAGEAVLLPGLVDTHVHINEPGRTEWEGFASATRAAAAGGVTTLVDMPLNSIPPTTTVAGLLAKAEAAAGQCAVDVGFCGGLVPGNVGELAALRREGALAFKCFLTESGVDEFPHASEADLRLGLPVLATLGAPLLCHAELSGPIDAVLVGGHNLTAQEARRYVHYLESRPRAAEDQAVALLARLSREYRAPLHVVHLSSADALLHLRDARDAGLTLRAETCPHYLHLCAEEIADGATAFKCAPPIRERENQSRLWAALREGLISQVVTDHSPASPALKCADSGDFSRAWGGIASLQLGLAVVQTRAAEHGVGLAQVVGWMAQAPAALVGLSQRKGQIAPGRDADLVFFDPDADFLVDGQRLQHRHKLTPYAGQRLRGVVRATFLRGEKIYEDGRFLGAPRGEWIRT